MQDHKSFFELDNEGVIHYVHSDEYNIYIVYEDLEDDILYRLTLDKDYVITTASEIKVGLPILDISFIKWNRPVLTAERDIVFTGCLAAPGGDFRFSIGNTELTIHEKVVFNNSFNLDTLESLKGVEVDAHVQKGNFLYVAGWDKENECCVFIETHIGRDKAVRRYSLDSDVGVAVLNTINIDATSGRIYVAGIIKANDQIRPYMETLLYKRPVE